MDTANNPLLSQKVIELGLSWCKKFRQPLSEAGFNYSRYSVGGVPPSNEQRFSTPECDDARNGIALYGGLSFIIESGLKRSAENQNSDLGTRIKAYLEIFNQLMRHASKDQRLLKKILERKSDFHHSFIPTNYFWANPGSKTTQVKVYNIKTGKIETILTANFMNEIVSKKSVCIPDSYIITAEAESLFIPLLERHRLDFYQLKKEDSITIEPSHLVLVETFHDSIYQRYQGRQIVFADPVYTKKFKAGSIIVPLSQEFTRKVIILLEPNMLYGLYKYKTYSELVDIHGTLPVYRLLNREEDI
jgi:hypothetical protein